MWRSLWRSIDRFSHQHFKHVVSELRQIKVVDNTNRELVVDLLQSIVEIVTYGDRQDPLIFELFMEYQVLAEFVRVLKIGRNSRIEVPLLQYLSIMIQNMDSEQATYYCFSNDYVNNIIAHEYKFDGGDLAPYFVSFLRAVSSKINKDTLCLLVKVQDDTVVSFPLYSEALKFAQHGEKMIQTAVRALTLNIYNVSDHIVFQYVTTPPASEYFSELVQSLKEQCIHLDGLVCSTGEINAKRGRKELLPETDKIIDDLYYFKDILSIGEFSLCQTVTKHLLDLLVFPILFSLVKPAQNKGTSMSAVSSLYIVILLVQVVGGKDIVNSVTEFILQPSALSSMQDENERVTDWSDDLGKSVPSLPESEGAENVNGSPASECHLENNSSKSCVMECPGQDNAFPQRSRNLASTFYDDQFVLLAFSFLLLTLADNKLTAAGPTVRCSGSKPDVVMDGSILGKFLPEILNALLKVVARDPPLAAQTKWHTGWFLQKLLGSHIAQFSDQDIALFNTSYNKSLQCFEKELDGRWFDCILDTLRIEWANYKAALEEPLDSKDPLFLLELAISQQSPFTVDETPPVGWQRMVDAVKVFVVNLYLKAAICKAELPGRHFPELMSSPVSSRTMHTSDISSASFGSEVSLGAAIPCRIAFSNAGIRDIFMIATGVNGKLLLVEKHPFRNRRGVVIAIAPLASLAPKLNEEHPTWLHLMIRESDPRINASKTKGQNSKASGHVVDGRWTLGFSNTNACEDARLLILEETDKQRSSIRSVLSSLLQQNNLGELPSGRDYRRVDVHSRSD